MTYCKPGDLAAVVMAFAFQEKMNVKSSCKLRALPTKGKRLAPLGTQ